MSIFKEIISTLLNESAEDLPLKAPMRRELTKLLSDLISPKFKTRYFPKIPLDDISKILATKNVHIMQEDNTPWSGFLMGARGNESFALAFKIGNRYVPINNSVLVLSWYKMQSGNYEINAYVS